MYALLFYYVFKSSYHLWVMKLILFCVNNTRIPSCSSMCHPSRRTHDHQWTSTDGFEELKAIGSPLTIQKGRIP